MSNTNINQTRGLMNTTISTAIVTDNNDPDGLGRVKVQYPWSEDHSESYWARITTPMAGDNQGIYFLPEVDQEVLVAFVNNDVQYPIVIGSLWNQNELPPVDNGSEENNIRKIRSRSGHEIILDDSDGAEKITIQDNSGSCLEFDTSNGHIVISSSMDVTINADANIFIEAANGLELKAGASLAIESAGELSLKGAIVRIN